MTYLVIAYIIFWAITFGLVFSILARQKATERNLASLKIIIEEEIGRDSGHER